MDSLLGRTRRPARIAAWFLGSLATVLAAVVLAGVWLSAGLAGRAGAAGDPISAAPVSPAAVRYEFPVLGQVSYEHTHHDYPATDVIAQCGAVVVAATSGVIIELSRVDRYDAAIDDGAARGGLFVSLLGDDGVRYYGSHLGSVAAGLAPGDRVAAGERLGLVGATGRAGACHLHFGISPRCGGIGDWWIRRGVIWPWPYLDAWRRGEAASPAPAVRGYLQAAGCPQMDSFAE